MWTHATNQHYRDAGRRCAPIVLSVTLLLTGAATAQVVIDMPPVPRPAPESAPESAPEPTPEAKDGTQRDAPDANDVQAVAADESSPQENAEQAARQRHIATGRFALSRYVGARAPARYRTPVSAPGGSAWARPHFAHGSGFSAYGYHSGIGFFGHRSRTVIVPPVVIIPPAHHITINLRKKGMSIED